MSKVSRKIALFGLFGFIALCSFAISQVRFYDGTRPTGLKPIDAAEFKKIRETWPRVRKVHLNQLGLERINVQRSKLGKPPLAVGVVKPIGREIESAILEPAMAVQAAAPNPELLGELPPVVDNSLQTFFPPVGDQMYLNACLPFATTYYQLSYMEALVRDPQNLTLHSPKWTYNMINGGIDGGSYPTDAYALLWKHGAAALAEFPYDDDYRAWCLTTSAWRNALHARTDPAQYIYETHTEAGMQQIKEALNNGYVLVFGTFIMSWQGQLIMDDPADPGDNAEVGKSLGYFLNGSLGSHAMTIVGYNDAIWADVNGNAVVDPGEKGAFKIVNSWGTAWPSAVDAGFIWLAYDALREVSAVPDGPADGRTTAFQQNAAFVLIPRVDYGPAVTAEFTVHHAKRGQMGLSLGISDTSASAPTVEWYPAALSFQGGDYAFDGTTTAVDATFVLDFTDLITEAGVEQKYWLGLWDNAGGDIATLKSYKVVDHFTDPDTETGSITTLPITADGSAEPTFAFTQYLYNGDIHNHPPALTESLAVPSVGTVNDVFHYQVHFTDPDGDSAVIHSVYIDDVQHEMMEYPSYPGYFYYDTTLPVGAHTFRFYFVDSSGGEAFAPAAGAYSGPVVNLAHFVEQPAQPMGETVPALGTSYPFSILGSECSEAHPIQYRFDWGDGTFSDWLPVGIESASHAWTASGSFAVMAQARCSVETSIVSPWSAWLIVTVPATVPFSESFMSSGFPANWVQQNQGEDVYNGWVLSPTANAGGAAYEMVCTFEDVVPGVTRLVTPPINTVGHTELRLRFKHFMQAWEIGGAVLKIQTSTDRMNWIDEAWTVTTTTDDIGPETVETTLVHNLESETTFVAFVISGDLYYFDYWYIDDVEIDATGKLRWFVKDVYGYYLWMNTMLPDESFEGWQPLQGGTSTAAAVATFNGRLHVVVKDAFTNALWHQSMDSEGAWSGWTMLDKESPSTPSLAVFGDRLYLAVREPDNRISCKSMGSGGTWGEWTDFPGATNTTPVLAAFNGKLHLVVKDLNFNFMWWNSMDTTGTWSGWQQLSGESPSPVAMAEYNDKLYMFVRGNTDDLYFRSMDTTGAWGPWTMMVGGTSIQPTVAAYNGRLYLVVKDANGYYIWMRSMDETETFGGWTMLPGGTSVPIALVRF